MRAQPDPGLAPQPDSLWLGTKAPLFFRPPDAPKYTGHKKSFFPQFHSLQAPAFCHWSSPAPPPGEAGSGGTGSYQFPHHHHHHILNPLGSWDMEAALELTSEPVAQGPHCPSTTKPFRSLRWPLALSYPSELYPSSRVSSRQPLRTPRPQRSLTAQP